MADVFISYARATAEVAQLIARTLRDEGYSVWVDDALPLHREFASVIEENLRSAKAVLVLWSAEARASRWVPAEADLAHERGTLVQLSLDGAPPPFPFNRLHCETAADWTGNPNAPAWGKVRHSIAVLVRSTKGEELAEAARPSLAGEVASERERLLAVLAFDNLSADPEMVDFCDGVSEEIQQTVAQGSGLKVVGRSSSFQFRGADKAVEKVAAALRVTHVLDGSVRRSGARVRISAQLIECAGGSSLWASRFEGDLEDVFALQDRIAEQVAHALEVTFSRGERADPIPPALYDIFLRARGLVTESTRQIDDAPAEAVELLERVVAAAPEYAPAWDLLALVRAWSSRAPQPRLDFSKARAGVVAAAETALRLDPRRGGPYVALAMLEPSGAHEQREKLLKTALRLAPTDAGALTEMSTFCWTVGRFAEALSYAEKACEINPLIPSALLNLAGMRSYAGDREGAVEMLRELHRRWPSNAAILIGLVNYAAWGGFWDAYDEAVASAEGLSLNSWQAATFGASRKYAQVLRTGDPALKAERLRRYTDLFERTGFLPLNLVETLSQFGLSEEAFDLALRSNYATSDPGAPMPGGPFPGVILAPWSDLKNSPRFLELCDKLGLCEYWNNTDAWPDCIRWTNYDFKAEARRAIAARRGETTPTSAKIA